jgi:PH/SEC7 domain-containing protein
MNLSHALASALPPPGYNTQRPYCFSLTLHNGEMSFFQAGTEELVQEWVSTCNYWAARRSRPPLPGGVSNLDYGWKTLESTDQPEDHTDSQSVFSNRSAKSRLSMHRTLGRRNMPAERNHLSDWKAPQPSLIPSKLDEETQLESLQKHVQSLVKDLAAHKALEAPLAKYVSTSHFVLIRSSLLPIALACSIPHGRSTASRRKRTGNIVLYLSIQR